MPPKLQKRFGCQILTSRGVPDQLRDDSGDSPVVRTEGALKIERGLFTDRRIHYLAIRIHVLTTPLAQKL